MTAKAGLQLSDPNQQTVYSNEGLFIRRCGATARLNYTVDHGELLHSAVDFFAERSSHSEDAFHIYKFQYY